MSVNVVIKITFPGDAYSGVGVPPLCSFLPQPLHPGTQHFKWTCYSKCTCTTVQTHFQLVACLMLLLLGHLLSCTSMRWLGAACFVVRSSCACVVDRIYWSWRCRKVAVFCKSAVRHPVWQRAFAASSH